MDKCRQGYGYGGYAMTLVVYDKQSGSMTQIIEAADVVLSENSRALTAAGYGCLLVENCPADANIVISGKIATRECSDTPAEVVMAKLRYERGQLLAASDWTQMPDSPLSPEKKQEWAAYRQALRDFPETCDLENPVWPAPPQ